MRRSLCLLTLVLLVTNTSSLAQPSAQTTTCKFVEDPTSKSTTALEARATAAALADAEHLREAAEARSTAAAEKDPKAKKRLLAAAAELEVQARLDRKTLERLREEIAALQDLARQTKTKSAVECDADERIAIHLANATSTRLRVSFDTTEGQHEEAEWDPAVSTELTRIVSLAPGKWEINVAAEPSTYTQQTGTVVIHTRFDALRKLSAKVATIEGTHVAMAAALSANKPFSPFELTAWPRPRLTFNLEVKHIKLDATRFATTRADTSGGLRGFGLAPTFATDTLSILAEIAVDRARAGALRLLKDRIVKPFCAGRLKVTLARLHLGDSDALALPRTCELLDGLRLDDILSSGRPLLIALRDDLRHTVAPAAVIRLAGNNRLATPALEAVLSVLNTAIDRGGFDGLEGQLMLDAVGKLEQLAPRLSAAVRAKVVANLEQALSQQSPADLPIIATALSVTCSGTACAHVVTDAVAAMLADPVGTWKEHSDKLTPLVVQAVHDQDDVKKLLGYACQARLVVAVVKRCSKGDCTAQEIATAVATPEKTFESDTTLPLALCWEPTSKKYLAPEGDAAVAQQLVVDGLQLVAPVVDGQGRDRAKAAVRLAMKLVKRMQASVDEPACRCLDAFAEVAVALIDEDYGTALGRFLGLASDLGAGAIPPELKKIAGLLGAIASYASVYRSTKDEDPKVARDARKRALSSIIDSLTDRTDRGDEWIVSLGSNVGLSATFSNLAFTKAGATEFAPSVRVPMGLWIERLPKPYGGLGGHLGLQIFDLGQFVRQGGDDKLDDVRWADFVSPGVEFGYTLAFIGDRAVNFTGHIAYAPSLRQAAPDDAMTDKDGVWRFGVSLGYYVPFVDLN